MSIAITPVLDNQIDVAASVEIPKTLGEQDVSVKWDITREQAIRAEEYEHSLSFLQAARLYKAVSEGVTRIRVGSRHTHQPCAGHVLGVHCITIHRDGGFRQVFPRGSYLGGNLP
jgi:hypothetical protein